MLESVRDLSPFLVTLAFLVVVMLQVVKTNRNLIRLYVVQSFLVTLVLFLTAWREGDHGFYFVAAATLFIKVILAPIFFWRLIHRYGMRFTTNNYLSLPLSLAVIMGLILFSFSRVLLPLAIVVPESADLVLLTIATILISVFMLINRRGAFSQMIGVLSLENSILLLALFIGIREPLPLEMGIIFDLVIWIIIAQAFIALIYKQFGSLNVTHMKHLVEE